MSFGWIFLINGVIGFLLTMGLGWFIEWMCVKKLGDDEGEKASSEMLQDLAREEDAGYNALYGPKRAPFMYALSNVITWFLWELVLPYVFWTIYPDIKAELERRKKDS